MQSWVDGDDYSYYMILPDPLGSVTIKSKDGGGYVGTYCVGDFLPVEVVADTWEDVEEKTLGEVAKELDRIANSAATFAKRLRSKT